jgi:hypothetical protein
MKRVLLPAALALALVATLAMGGVVTAKGDPFIGTWHQRDVGTSNIFYFVDEPVGGVFPILFYDDFTGVCNQNGNHGPMLWSGFGQKTDATHLEGSFGTYWCPDDGFGVSENPLPLLERTGWTLVYDPATDTVSGGIGGCVGTRQPAITTVAKAESEIAKGTFPPPNPGPPFVCES